MQGSRHKILGLGAGWIVSAIAIVLIPLIAIEAEDRSNFFIHRIFWSLYLSTIVWVTIGSFFIRSNDSNPILRTAGGVLPAFGLVLGSYAAISFGLMLFFSFLPAGESPYKLHIILQIALICCVGVLYSLMSLNRSAASSGFASTPINCVTPQKLVSFIELKEQEIKQMGADSMPLVRELKSLRELIKYSISSSGGVLSSEGYSAFSAKIMDLCNSSSEPSLENVKDLQNDAKYIAASIKN